MVHNDKFEFQKRYTIPTVLFYCIVPNFQFRLSFVGGCDVGCFLGEIMFEIFVLKEDSSISPTRLFTNWSLARNSLVRGGKNH